jgi:hypothetical protein
MATWVWLNLALGAVFVLAIAGVPLWMVIKHPDARHKLEHELVYVGHAVRDASRADVGRASHVARPAYAVRAGQAGRAAYADRAGQARRQARTEAS